MEGICQCGCGGKTNKYPQSITKKGIKKGEYAKFIKGHIFNKPPNKWSLTHNECIECGTTKIKYKGHGLCINCYNRKWDKTPQGRELYNLKLTSPEERTKRYLRQHRYYLEHKENAYASAKRWVKNNPEKRKVVSINCCHKRRDKIKNGNVTKEFLLNLKANTTHCPLCRIKLDNNGRKPNGYNLDHVKPLSIGGRHEESNLRYICRTCNLTRDDGRLRLHLFTRKSTA